VGYFCALIQQVARLGLSDSRRLATISVRITQVCNNLLRVVQLWYGSAMSLDKYVCRGYSGSVGDTTGSWVARTAETPSQQAAPVGREGGTSFVLGGGKTATYGYRAKSKNQADLSRAQASDEIMHRGTQLYGHRRDKDDIRQNCFGGSSKSFQDYDTSNTNLRRLLRFFLFVVAALAVWYTYCTVSDSASGRVRAERERRYQSDWAR
jgi:hypothetical protein